jgi:hypothetical protein
MSVTLTGGPFADAKGTAVASGTLRLQLSKDARKSGGQVCRAYQIDIPLDATGNIATNTAVVGNDELTPTDTYYVATVLDSNRSPVYGPVLWTLSGGGTVNVNTINPSTGVASAGVSVNFSADQIYLDRANQDVLLERDSANVLRLATGDSFIPQTDAQELGSSLKRWLMRIVSAVFYGSSSGSTTLQASATASGTLTLPAATDTLVGKATTDTLTNKTFDTAGTGNVLKINGTTVSAKTGTGSVVLATSPAITTPTITDPTISSNAITGSAARLVFKQAMVRVTKSGAQSINNSTTTAITWDTETYDTDTLHSTVSNTSRLTASVTGKWLVTTSIGFAASATGSRIVTIRKNGTTDYAQAASPNAGGSDGVQVTVSDIVDLAASDYVEINVTQNSGGALNVNTSSTQFSMALIGV